MCPGRRSKGLVMMEGAAKPQVIDVPEQGRFVVELEGHTAELVYQAESGRLILVHNGVPQELEGRGIGATLVRAAPARASDQGLTVMPWRPFARRGYAHIQMSRMRSPSSGAVLHKGWWAARQNRRPIPTYQAM